MVERVPISRNNVYRVSQPIPLCSIRVAANEITQSRNARNKPLITAALLAMFTEGKSG